MDKAKRIYPIADFVRPSDDKPIRSVVSSTDESAVIVWHANPGQEIAAHTHPNGQDTWTVISGEADYYEGDGAVRRIKVGDIAIARPDQVHGAYNCGTIPFIFVSVVAPANAGYAAAER